VPEAVRISRRSFRTIKQNLWLTAGYNIVGITLAAVGWLPPIAAAAAQSFPDVAVMLNSSRLFVRRGGEVTRGNPSCGQALAVLSRAARDRRMLTIRVLTIRVLDMPPGAH